MVELFPVVRLDDRSTFGVWEVAPIKVIVVRLQDIVSYRTFRFSNIFDKLKKLEEFTIS